MWKDFLLDYRNPLSASTQLIFSLGSGVLVGLVYRSSVWPAGSLIPAALPIVLVFQAVFASYNSFLREAESRTIDGLRLLPVGPEVVFASKLIYSIINIFAFTILFLLSLLFFAWPINVALAPLTAWVLLSSLYMGGVSSLSSAMMIYSRARGTLAPVLVLLLSLPFFQSSAVHVGVISQGYMPRPGWPIPLTILSLGFILVSLILARYVLE